MLLLPVVPLTPLTPLTLPPLPAGGWAGSSAEPEGKERRYKERKEQSLCTPLRGCRQTADGRRRLRGTGGRVEEKQTTHLLAGSEMLFKLQHRAGACGSGQRCTRPARVWANSLPDHSSPEQPHETQRHIATTWHLRAMPAEPCLPACEVRRGFMAGDEADGLICCLTVNAQAPSGSHRVEEQSFRQTSGRV